MFQAENFITSNFKLAVAFFILAQLFAQMSGQIPKEEIPPELKNIVNSDLDKWEAPEEILKNYPYYLSGFDEENRPIWVLEFGKWDIRSAIEKGEKYAQDLDKHIDQSTWHVLNSTGLRATPENPVKEFIMIIDAEGFNLVQLNSARTVGFVTRKLFLITIATRFAYSVYVLNANYIAERFLSLLKPILGKEFEKFQIYGTNSQKWIPKILRDLPKDQIAEWYGGAANFKPVQIYGKK